jgi:hypothetical protein
MKKILLMMVVAGLILWNPLLADAKGGKKDGKLDKHYQKGIKKLQEDIKKLQEQIHKIQLTPGPVGPQGPPGVDGAPGADGADGAPGSAGANGADGASGADGYTPVKGVDYFDGADGAPGAKGDKGDTGEQGIQGPQWVAGDGTDLDFTIDDLYDRIENIESFGPRFTDMRDGTIIDNETGLRWLKDASCSALNFTDSDGKATLPVAYMAAATLANGTCGLRDASMIGDWRLPTEDEWLAFVSTEYVNPALVNRVGDARWEEGDAFVGVQSEHYWSVTQRAVNPDYFRAVFMFTGLTYTRHYNQSSYIWPVRSSF